MDRKADQKTLKACLKMFELLKEKGKMKAPELAKELGLNNLRSIYYYKKILNTLGYNVISSGGFKGGYEVIEPQKLSDDELSYLKIQLSHDSFGEMRLSEKNKELFERIKSINKGAR